MLKRFWLLLFTPLLLCGCASTLTNLTPTQQSRNPDNLYPVEFALSTRQQTLRWDSIQPKVVVGNQTFDMRPTQLMSNRWEGALSVPAGIKEVNYHYQIDFLYNSFGKPKPGSAVSSDYTLHIRD